MEGLLRIMVQVQRTFQTAMNAFPGPTPMMHQVVRRLVITNKILNIILSHLTPTVSAHTVQKLDNPFGFMLEFPAEKSKRGDWSQTAATPDRIGSLFCYKFLLRPERQVPQHAHSANLDSTPT